MTKNKLGIGQIKVTATGFFSLLSMVGISFYGLPLFYDFWVHDFGWTRAIVTSGNAFGKIIIVLFAFIAGWIIDRYGPRRVMLAGIMMGGIALIGLSMASSLWQFYLFYLFNALGYMCGGPLPNQVLISRWFKEARGKAMGIAYLGIGIGGMLVPHFVKRLNIEFGWHQSLMLLGILMIVLALPLVLFVKDNPDGINPNPKPSEPKIPLNNILKSWPFYLLLIGSMCSIAAVSGTSQNLKLFFSIDLKYSQSHALNVISLILAASLAGRLIMGWLADRIPKKYVMILIYSLIAGSISLLFIVNKPGIIYLFACIFGIGLGGDYMIIPLMAAELFGVRVMGRIMGIILTADGLGEGLSPMLVGWLRDRAGSYAQGFISLIALALIGIVTVSMLPKNRAL